MQFLTRFIQRSWLLALVFGLPAILLAQRWDKMVAFPISPFSSDNNGLSGLTSGPDGALWYADPNRQVVGRMTTAGAVTEYNICCTSPQAITSGPDGALWFGLNGSIGRITTSGGLTSYPLPSCCASVQGITTGPDGALWFTEGGFCCGNSTGNRIGRITTAGVITEYAQIPNSNPVSIVTGSDGALWFTEGNGNRIGRITTSGHIVEFPVSGCCGLEHIAAGQDGALWFTEPNANQIGRITTHGAITEYALPNANSRPWGITGGPDGGIWFTEQSQSKIGRITAVLPGSAGDMVIEYSLPTNNGAPGDITAGPDGNLWFVESAPSASGGVTESLGQAAACGLGLNLTYANSDLGLSFTLGTSQTSTFGAYLIDGAGLKKLWSKSIPAIDPPRSFSKTITGVPSMGTVSVLSTIGSPSNGLICYDLELQNTSAVPATPAELDQARRTIVDSGIVENLPEP